MTERGMPPTADPPETTVSELHALYREGAASEPGAQLDQSILAAARADLRDASASAARRHRPWWKAWLKPASVMAVAVLGLSLTWQQRSQLSDQQEPDRRQEIGSTHEQPKTANMAEQGAPAQKPAALAPAKKPDQPALKARARRQDAEPAAVASPQAFPAQEEAGKSKAGAASGAVAQPAPAPLPALRETPAEKKNMRGEADAARTKDDRSSVRGDAPAPGSAPPMDKVETERRAAPAAAAADALGKSAAAAATPQAWLQQIRDLRAAGREAEAAQSLARFRARYPDFVVPDDLKALK